MPGFEAAYAYGGYLAIVIFGVIVGSIVNLLETIFDRTSIPFIRLICSYTIINVLLIVMDGNIEGELEIAIPLIGCAMLECFENIIRDVIKRRIANGE